MRQIRGEMGQDPSTGVCRGDYGLEMGGIEVGRSSLLEAQRTISPLLAEPDPPETLLPRLIETVCETLDWSLGALWRPVAGAARMRCGATWHRPEPGLERVIRQLQRIPVAPGEGPLGRVWVAGAPAWMPSVDAVVAPDLAHQAGLQGLFAMPVTRAERTEGLLAFASERREDPEPELVAALELVAGQLAHYLDHWRRHRALLDSEQRAAQVVDALEAGVLVMDAEGVVTRCNGSAARLIGADRAGVLGRRLPLPESEVLLDADGTPITAANNPIARVLRTGRAERRILMWFLRQGKSVWLEMSLQPLPRGGGVVCSLIDVTERRDAERDLREARDRAERYLNMAGSVIVALDQELRVTMINRAGLELLGYSKGELMGAEWIRSVVPPDARPDAKRLLGSMLEGVNPRDLAAESAEGPLLTKEGEVRTIEWRTAVLKGPGGVPTGLLCSGNDVTERVRSEQAIAHLAYHDQLTGLPNRALLEEHLEVALARAERDGRELALLFLDLDNFKIVNDSLGHAAGDRLLQLVAERLTSITRASDLLARHGGDELLLLLTDIEGGTTVEVAESVAQKLLEALSEPFQIGGTEFEIGASVGVAVFPHDGRSAAALLRTADATMYQAKAAGRNRVALHRPGLGLDGAGELISATTRLREALTDGELTVYYQPIVSVPEGSVAAVEALVRWEDPRRGLVPGSDFLQLAEETGLVESIGDWVIETVFSQAAWWRDRGLDARVHFNLSARQLRQRRVIDSIGEQLAAAGLEPDRLTAEIGESAAMAESRRDSSLLQRLRNLGVHLAVDNFGAGNSSLARLRELPVEELKLHRLLLRGVPYDRNANALARAAIELASGLGMRAIAEGVETEDQWRFLVDHGCPLAQGFHLGRPMAAEEITPLLPKHPGTRH